MSRRNATVGNRSSELGRGRPRCTFHHESLRLGGLQSPNLEKGQLPGLTVVLDSPQCQLMGRLQDTEEQSASSFEDAHRVAAAFPTRGGLERKQATFDTTLTSLSYLSCQ